LGRGSWVSYIFAFDLSRVGTLRTAFQLLSVELLVLLASQKLFWAAFVPSAQITSAWVRRTMRPEDQGQGRVRGYSARFHDAIIFAVTVFLRGQVLLDNVSTWKSVHMAGRSERPHSVKPPFEFWSQFLKTFGNDPHLRRHIEMQVLSSSTANVRYMHRDVDFLTVTFWM
jgi:hypothetical protein